MTVLVDDYIAARADVKAYLDTALLDAMNASSRESELYDEVKDKLLASGARLVAHYYVDPDIQRLAEETGGIVSDSLEMARFGAEDPASKLIVAGVSFMGETAKILSPEKRVFMPTLEATCSLDIGCPDQAFQQFCDSHPDRTVVVYANTSAAVKARADWVVTSSIAVDIVDALAARGVFNMGHGPLFRSIHPKANGCRYVVMGFSLRRSRGISLTRSRCAHGNPSRCGTFGSPRVTR